MSTTLSYAPYKLCPQAALNSRVTAAPRCGALLRVEWPDGGIGFADCHPWPELGDLPLQEQFAAYGKGEPTSLLACSLQLARFDALASQQGLSLFAGLEIPKSHWLSPNCELLTQERLDNLLAQGFTHIKLKIGHGCHSQAHTLKELLATPRGASLLWRLDANGSFTKKGFEAFMEVLSPYLQYIDFIEDPTLYCSHQWAVWQERYGVALAADRYLSQAWGDPLSAAVLILKPAFVPFSKMVSAIDLPQRCIVTSYLDHPLGQISAAWCAASIRSLRPNWHEVCGLLSHHCYSPSDFSALLKALGSRLFPPVGTRAWGFDSLLSELEWTKDL